MKILIALSPLMILSISCKPSNSGSRDPQGQDLKTDGNGESKLSLRYRFTSDEDRCDTYPRIASDLEQLCRNLQLPEANNNCAESQRHEFFLEACPHRTWDPVRTRYQVLRQRGFHLDCEVADFDFSDSTYVPPNTGRFISRQHSVDPVMILPHNHFVLQVEQGTQFGRQHWVRMTFWNKDLSGSPLAQQTFVNQRIGILNLDSPKAFARCRTSFQ